MKYLSVIILHIKKNLVDRARFVIWILVDTLGVIILPFVWLAILGDRDMLLGFTASDLITYFLLVFIIKMVATSHIAEYLHPDIMKGDLNKLLLKPILPLIYHGTAEYGFKLLSAVVAGSVFLLAWVLFPSYIALPASTSHTLWFFVFLIMAQLQSSAIQIIVGLATFWFGETSALMQLQHILEKIFSGDFGPLTLFPAVIQTIGAWLPFQYLVFIPIQIYLGNIPSDAIAMIFLKGLGWMMLYFLCIILLWRRGMRRYEGVGI